MVNNFGLSMTKWYKTICLDRPSTTTEVFLKRKVVNKNLCSDFSIVNTGRPIITYCRNSNNKRNKEKSFVSINEWSNVFDSVKVHRLKIPKNVLIGHSNVNSVRNKIIAVEELMRDKVGICLFAETKFDETFPNQHLWL